MANNDWSNQLAPTNQAVSDAGQGHDPTMALMACERFRIWKGEKKDIRCQSHYVTDGLRQGFPSQ